MKAILCARRSCHALAAFALVVLLLVAAPAVLANIDLVTLPPKDRSQLTIYNQEDLTLVREQRTVTFAKGLNRIQFSWAGTLIDPTSLDITFPGAPEGRYKVVDVSYPANTQNLLIWHIEAAEAGPGAIDIMCFASGLSWAADYVLVADPAEENLRLESWVKVVNRSGEDYINAETRLLVGEINLVEKIAELARRGVRGRELEEMRREMAGARMKTMALADMPSVAAMPETPKEIIKEGVSEYFLYTIEGRETIEDQWAKRLPSFDADGLPFDVSYEYDEGKYGNNVILFYKLKNDEEHELGETPLPGGRFAVYRSLAEGGLSYVNSASHKYIPVGEDIELNLGADGLITIEPKMIEFSRDNIEFDRTPSARDAGRVIGFDETRRWVLEIRNSRDREIPIKITRHFSGDWEIDTGEKYERKSKDTLVFERKVPALSTLTIEYEITERKGSRARK